MENANYIEWSFENFSCWDSEIHGNLNPGPFRLYPRGLDGDGENLVVRVWDKEHSSRVEVCFVGADGSLICKQQVEDPEWDGNWTILPTGPMFEDVLKTRKNKNLHRDVLTLRLYLSDNDFRSCGCTTIGVLERSLKIPASVLKNIDVKTPKRISNFSLENSDQIYFLYLNACQVGSTEEDAEISIVFSPIDAQEKVLFQICVSLLDPHDVVIKSTEGKHIFRDKKSWTLPTSFLLKEVNGSDSCLILSIKLILKDVISSYFFLNGKQVEILSIEPNIPSENSETLTNVTSSNSPSAAVLLQELMCLYQDQDFSDFTLKCGNITFPVHRAILSARSPVFKIMLTTDMREATSGQVDIGDLDPSTLARFLTFLYSGEVEDLQCDIALKLYYAADKYQVPTLKKECADFLCDNVSVSNVCDVLSLADSHQDDRMTSVAHHFVLKNYNDVLRSEEWKQFVTKDPGLGVKTLTQFAERNTMVLKPLRRAS